MWRRASSMARSLRLIWDVCEFNGVKGREGISENGDVLIGGHIRRSPLYSAHLWLRTPSASAIPRPIFMAEAVSSSRTTATLQPTTIVRRSLAFRSLHPRLLSRSLFSLPKQRAESTRARRPQFEGRDTHSMEMGERKGREDSIDEGTERFGYSSLGGFPSSLVNDGGTSVITSGK